MPFNKTLIVISSTRYEIGRHDFQRWTIWNNNLRRIAGVRGNVVGANNAYDQQYMKYFTGLNNIKLLPSYCGYIVDRYNINSQGRGKDVLIGPSRGVSPILLTQLEKSQARFLRKSKNNSNVHLHLYRTVRLTPIRTAYPGHHEYSEIASHPAMVFLPYQVSLMSFFEFYRMNIPLYVPSARLLALWHVKYAVLHERTWDRVYGRAGHKSAVSRWGAGTGTGTGTGTGVMTSTDADGRGGTGRDSPPLFMSDPNDEFNISAVSEWVGLSDYYQWPHIRLFDSWSELLDMLKSDDFGSISQNMKAFNAFTEDYVRNEWLRILNNIADIKEEEEEQHSGGGGANADRRNLASDINESLERYYMSSAKISTHRCV